MSRPCTTFAAVSLALMFTGAATAQDCQNCKEWNNPEDSGLFPQDAMCCFPDTLNNNCAHLPGFTVKWNMSACWVVVVPEGWRCGGEASGSCFDTGDRCDDTASAEERLPGCSPILLDLDSDGFHLAGLESAVPFDFDGDGSSCRYSWTRAGSFDGFLCYDRNGNGLIDSGRELFGNVTPLFDGSTGRSGFDALQELDSISFGGNDDRKLTAEDAAFQDLCVWFDWDHDAVSDVGELVTLDEVGVIELPFDHHETRRRDVHGNEFRYQGSVVLSNPQGAPRRAVTYDVFFVSTCD